MMGIDSNQSCQTVATVLFDPNTISAITDVCLLIAALVALYLSAKTWKTTRAANRISILASEVAAFSYSLDQIISDDDVRSDRNELMEGSKFDALIAAASDTSQTIDFRSGIGRELWRVLTAHDRVASIALRLIDLAEGDELIGSSLLADFQKDEMKKIYKKSKPFIETLRNRLARPNWCVDLEKLAKRLLAAEANP